MRPHPNRNFSSIAAVIQHQKEDVRQGVEKKVQRLSIDSSTSSTTTTSSATAVEFSHEMVAVEGAVEQEQEQAFAARGK